MSSSVATKRTTRIEEEDYDDCNELISELNEKNDSSSKTSSSYLLRNKLNLADSKDGKSSKEVYTHNPSSPMKRNKNESWNEESPKKRAKATNLFDSHTAKNDSSSKTTSASVNIKSLNLMAKIGHNEWVSPRKNRSLNIEQKKSFASTPKTERRTNPNRVKELAENSSSSAAIERNLSNNWGDILEELEEQTKELNVYIEKVAEKYKIDKDKLLKSVESDAETLRKRQKRINFGKVTPEYQRYILAIARNKREAYHPKTPNKYRKCSRRKFDGLIKKWRKLLHVWGENPDALVDYKNSMENDDPDNDDEDMTDDFGGASNITASNFSYNVDDYDIIEDDVSDNVSSK